MDHNEIAKLSISQSLSWTHHIRLMRISDPKERKFYEIEAANNNWSVKELNRQFDSALYQRLALSRDKDKILELSKKGQVVEKPEDILKDPYILEFTGLKELPEYSESRLEQSLIDELQSFLLELGKGRTEVRPVVFNRYQSHNKIRCSSCATLSSVFLELGVALAHAMKLTARGRGSFTFEGLYRSELLTAFKCKSPARCAELHDVCGEDEIRTRGTVNPYVSLANWWFQPLTHLSGNAFLREIR